MSEFNVNIALVSQLKVTISSENSKLFVIIFNSKVKRNDFFSICDSMLLQDLWFVKSLMKIRKIMFDENTVVNGCIWLKSYVSHC